MSITIPCRQQSLIALRLLVYVANHIGTLDQAQITSDHLSLLINAKHAATKGRPWWTENTYRNCLVDIEERLDSWYGCEGLNQFTLLPSDEVGSGGDVAVDILQAFYSELYESKIGTIWHHMRGNMKCQEDVLRALNRAISIVTERIMQTRPNVSQPKIVQ